MYRRGRGIETIRRVNVSLRLSWQRIRDILIYLKESACIATIVLTSLLNNILWKAGGIQCGSDSYSVIWVSGKRSERHGTFRSSSYDISAIASVAVRNTRDILQRIFKYSTTDGKVSIILIQQCKPSILCVYECIVCLCIRMYRLFR